MNKILQKLYLKYWRIPRDIRFYHSMLESDKWFTEVDYRYFGKRIYDLRKHRKSI